MGRGVVVRNEGGEKGVREGGWKAWGAGVDQGRVIGKVVFGVFTMCTVTKAS